MHTFEYKLLSEKLLTLSIVRQLSGIHEHKGKQELFLEASPDVLSSLLKIAVIQSTRSSNRIEGIVATDSRLKELVEMDTAPANRSEAEIAGYRKALSLIHESYEFIEPKPGVLRQLHQILYSFLTSEGGHYKNSDNIIEEKDSNGVSHVRFRTVPAFQTPEAVEKMCQAFSDAWEDPKTDQLLLIPLFILDFLSIHPFNDGNGRMSRLLTLLLLYRAGYISGKYISLEHLVEESKETYYSSLKSSSQGWHENQNSYVEFTEYLLGVILRSYQELESRVRLSQDRSLSKPARVEQVIRNQMTPVSKRKLLELLPDIGTSTVERTLSSLLKEGKIIKTGKGRGTKYFFNSDL
ncbi:Fic family protein [Faecalibaculum rodentium]|uniref:Cell division protein Fic n=2 Tax=Faecalibaculum rodentium TaxID=1702221 RepID=A0A140DYW7_9FIRM|nr:Fic family protein [Faecalibaculum rodentium]AMK55844.1 cell division protein Fic [Faecalibaculum rodentium]